MRITAKKAVGLVVRLAVMGAILTYAGKHLQTDDELALRAVGSSNNAGDGRANVVWVAEDGRRVELVPNARVTVVGRRDAVAGSAVYEVKTQDGALLSIPAEQVEGSAPVFQRLPGIVSIVRALDPTWMILALLVFGVSELLVAFRWRVLLRSAQSGVGTWTVVQLHYVGLFFTTFMPGGSGGDVVKAVYLTRYAKRKTEAVTMIFLDRAIGMLGLLIMAGVVVLLRWEQMHGLGREIALLLGILALGAILYFSTWVRRIVHFESILARLPFSQVLTKIDAAVLGLRKDKSAFFRALGINAVLQVVGAIGIYFAGIAIGIHDAKLTHYLVFVPISYLANALPISFGGIGLMEGAFMKLFSDAGVATASQGFMVGLLTRVMVVFWSLPGGIAAARFSGRGADEPTELEQSASSQG